MNVLKMNLREALRLAKRFVIYGEPDGELGSFEPLKGSYNEETDEWEIKCTFTKNSRIRTAIVKIDDDSRNIVGFDIS